MINMYTSLGFIRGFFCILSLFLMLTYVTAHDPLASDRWVLGLLAGSAFAAFLLLCDFLFRRFHLRSFNIVIVGLFVGYLMGKALVLIFGSVRDMTYLNRELGPNILELIDISLFIFGTYLGTIMTLRFSDELYLVVPFVRFESKELIKKDLLLDRSVLIDTRLVDLAATGLLDGHCIIARFTAQDLYSLTEASDERLRQEGRRGIEIIRKLEEMKHLHLRWQETDFNDIHDHAHKMVRLARLLKANIVTEEINSLSLSSTENISMITMSSLAGALKPLMHEGETLSLKIQRQGKEPRQGIGYLDDGTMVVVNGAGYLIGKFVQAIVLSIKASSAGRIIFANLVDMNDKSPHHTLYNESDTSQEGTK